MAMFLVGVLIGAGALPPSNWAELRLYLVMCYSSIGRSGEAAKTSFDLSEWDTLSQTFVTDFAEQKVGLRKEVLYVVDRDNFNVDFYHALACYLMVRGLASPPPNAKGEAQPDWLFPQYATQQPSTASKRITKLIHTLATSGVTGIFQDHTGTSLRIGSLLL
jgi:hypothetical protein